MTAPTIISTVEDRSKVLNAIIDLDLNGKQWEVAIKRHRKRRSLKQNNLMWMWIDEITPYVSEATGYEKDEIHEIFKQNFLPYCIKLKVGDLKAQRWTTKHLDTKQMAEYCDRIHRWASGFGIVLPLPPEQGYDGDGRPLDEKLTVAEAIERSEEKTWDAKQANGADDDWGITAGDIMELIEAAPSIDSLEEITALNERALNGMKEHSPDHYTRVMRAMESRGEDLNRAE